jgi:hypothetical protein
VSRGSAWKAALLGGVLSGLLSALPVLGLLCCAWAAAGGAFAAWVVASDSGRTAGAGRSVLAGWLSGAIGGLLFVPATMLVTRLQAGPEGLSQQAKQAREYLEPSAQQLPPGVVEAMVDGFLFIEFNAWSVVMMVLFAFVFSCFGLLGGLVGAALFSGGAQAAAPSPSPPAVTPPGAEPGAPTPPLVGELPPDDLPALPERSPDDGPDASD